MSLTLEEIPAPSHNSLQAVSPRFLKVDDREPGPWALLECLQLHHGEALRHRDADATRPV
jgi:hypothetical protein